MPVDDHSFEVTSPFWENADDVTRSPGRSTASGGLSRSAQWFAFYSLAVIAGVMLANLCLPTLFLACPHDLLRVQFLLTSLREHEPAPEMCILGDSQAMTGIDARQLSDELQGKPEVWNLGSYGQQVLESFLYYQELPDSVKTVVHCITAKSLERSLQMSSNRYHAFYHYGYQPDAATLASVKEHAPPDTAALFAMSDFHTRFESRWALRAAIDTQLRQMVRKDLKLEEARTNLYYPSVYTKPVDEKTLKRTLREYEGKRADPHFVPNSNTKALLLEVAEECRVKGIRFVLLVLPERPELRQYVGEPYAQELQAFCDNLQKDHGILTIDGFDLLDAAFFIDERHVSPAGAKILTTELARRLENPE